MRLWWLVAGTLACWRITHLLQAEDGPWDLVVYLRRRAGDGIWGQVLDCFYCLSLWVAAPLAGLIGADWMQRLLLWPALSGGAILLERAVARPASVSHSPWLDESGASPGERTPSLDETGASLDETVRLDPR